MHHSRARGLTKLGGGHLAALDVRLDNVTPETQGVRSLSGGGLPTGGGERVRRKNLIVVVV